MNVQRTKRAMRDWMTKRKMTVAKMMYDSRVWGRGAMTNAWRITGRHGKATTDKAALWTMMNPQTPAQKLRGRIVAGYKSLLGVREGSAKQKAIAAFSGLSWAEPWCAMTAWYVLKHEAGYNGASRPDNVAYVPSWENWAKAKGILVSRANAMAGMYVTFRWDGGKGVGTGDHIGIIAKPGRMRHTVQYSVGTMEGNASGSPDGVFTETRWSWQVNCIIDPARLQKEN